jgi:VWFA-related protein
MGERMPQRMGMFLLSLLVCPAIASPQNAAPAPETTIHVTTRMVYVDVIVRDRNGHVVHGLGEKDFHLQEDGKPQTIDYFTAHTFDTPTPQRTNLPPPQTAVNIAPGLDFSNVPAQGEHAGAVNIILFDLANTPHEDQVTAYKQLVQFLRALPRGQQVALFALTGRLTMIQNFTGSTDRLIEAANSLSVKDYGLILSKAAEMEGSDIQAEFVLQVGRTISGGETSGTRQIGISSDADSASRADITVAALLELARAVSGYPGRKNLLWLSESFPVALGSQLDSTRYLSLSTVRGARQAANLIASAQIAVYPISLLGLEVEGVSAAASGVGDVKLGAGNGDTIGNQFNGRQALKATMNDLADQTGGEAFAGTNSFADALRRSMDDGSNYYTLAYRPRNQQWNGQFRKLHVDLATKGYSLSYRRGYFAYPDSSSSANSLQELNAAMQPAMPQSTMLALQSKVILPASAQDSLTVKSLLDPESLTLPVSEDGHRRGKLLVLLVAFKEAPDAKEKPAAAAPQTSGVLNLDFDAAQYQEVRTNGLVFAQQLKLPPGKYRLRLGVTDLESHRLGTLDMPVDVTTANSSGR